MMPRTLAAPPPNYNITNLGAVFGTNSRALGLSDTGYVVGWSGTTSNHHAFIWSAGTTTDLGTGGGSIAQFSSVNNVGVAVGWTTITDGRIYSYMGSSSGAGTNVLPSLLFHEFRAISNNWLASSFRTNTSLNYGGRQSAAVPPYLIDPTVHYVNSDSNAVNERGHFAGTYMPGGFNDAFVWHADDPLIGNSPYPDRSITASTPGDPGAVGLNDNYQAVIGQTNFSNTYFIWNYRTGGLTSVDVDPVFGTGAMFDINNRAEVVGNSLSGATLYRDGTFYNLNTLANPGSGLHLADAHAVNDKGWIVGYGSLSGGNTRAYLAIPEAEPGLVNNPDFERGDLIGWSPKGGGIADAVSLGGGDWAAKLQVWQDPYLGHVAILDQYLDTFASQNALDFAYQFRTTTGALNVSLDGQLLATLNAPGTLSGFFESFHLDLTNPLLQNRTDILLDFSFDGPIGSVVWLDNVALMGVPEPSTLVLGGVGLAALALFHRRRGRRSSLPILIAGERY